MANPQKENGYTAIANELMDKICAIRIPGEAMQIFLFIMRKTYGWNKKSDNISYSQFVEGTGIIKQHIGRAIEKLLEMNLIIVTNKGYRNGAEYRINKDYRKWKRVPKKVTVTNNGTPVTNNGYKEVPKKVTTKDNKDTKQKTIERVKLFSDDVDNIYKYFKSTIDKKLWPNNSKKNKWLDGIDKCIRIDKYSKDQIIEIIDYFRNDPFWSSNFLSPLKLRKTNNDGVKYIDYFWNKLENNNGNRNKRRNNPSRDNEFSEQGVIKDW